MTEAATAGGAGADYHHRESHLRRPYCSCVLVALFLRMKDVVHCTIALIKRNGSGGKGEG